MKRKYSLLTYIIWSVLLLLVLGIIFLPTDDKILLVYALIFTFFTAILDGTILVDWIEKKINKKEKNPLL